MSVSVVRFKIRCNILISGKIIKEMPGSVPSGTRYVYICMYVCVCIYIYIYIYNKTLSGYIAYFNRL